MVIDVNGFCLFTERTNIISSFIDISIFKLASKVLFAHVTRLNLH